MKTIVDPEPGVPAFADALIGFQAAVRVAIEMAHERNATQGPYERPAAEVTAEVVGRIGREYKRLYDARER